MNTFIVLLMMLASHQSPSLTKAVNLADYLNATAAIERTEPDGNTSDDAQTAPLAAYIGEQTSRDDDETTIEVSENKAYSRVELKFWESRFSYLHQK
ncbi:MAG: hypothetical protein LBT20_02410 [Clostridiales bacterium]|jgi:hypothetical protein|nr:hypothetical protein [Clostridiales bacterium]